MRKILYAKYNRTRVAAFQTCTKLIEMDGVRYVEKEALTEAAVDHIHSFQHTYDALKLLYQNVTPCGFEMVGDVVRFVYIDGKTVAELIEDNMDTLQDVMEKIRKYIEMILCYQEERMCSFVSSEEFERIFGCHPELDHCEAVNGADLDPIFDNFIVKDDTVYGIDYEWFFDVMIPVEYIKYRSVFYFYSKNHAFFSGKISLKEYLSYFGIDEASAAVYDQMDDMFQQYVHGEDRCSIYTRKYEQPNRDIHALLNRWHDIEGEIAKRDQVAVELSELVRQKEERLVDLNDQIHQVNHELAQMQGDVTRMQENVAQMHQKLSYYQGSFEQVTNSLSWKITKPLRFLADGGAKLIRKSRITSVICDGMIYFCHNGLRSTFRRIKELYGRKKSVMTEEDFQLSSEEIERQRAVRFEYAPVISILVPLYNTPEKFLREMIESVKNQTYGNWQLCLADGSDDSHTFVEKICKGYCRKDSRIVYKHLEENRGISDNTNACIELATGDFIGLFDHDDLLTQNALFEIVKRLNEQEDIDAVYTDEDKLLYDEKNESSKYVEPHCKSDFNLDLFRTNNYICHFFVVRKTIVDQIGGFRKEYDGSQDFDFIFRCVEQARRVEHIAKILYHWRIHANSTAANPHSKMYCYEAGKRAIEAHLERRGIQAVVEMTEHLGFYRVKYPVKGNPLVSIIIPNKDEKATLEKCIHSILEKTSYDNYEIVIVENNSETEEIFHYYEELAADARIRIVHWKEEFNYSKINNFGVKQSKGEYILLLNNDVEVISENWMEELLSNCQRSEVGITGAKLLYPDHTVQHAGVIIGLGGIAGHAFVGMDANHPGYFGRAFVQQNLSAVTAACLMVSRAIYDEVSGLEETLKVAFNDVDFCLRVREAGYLVVMNPNVRLYHYESKSRGAEDTPEKQARFNSEVHYMAERWRGILENGDPYYNQNLTLLRGDFSMKGKDEVVPRYL